MAPMVSSTYLSSRAQKIHSLVHERTALQEQLSDLNLAEELRSGRTRAQFMIAPAFTMGLWGLLSMLRETYSI